MDTNVKRVHLYHAGAHALGGHIERPFNQHIPVQAPLSLPPVGGHASSRVEGFDFNSAISFKAAYTHVSGSQSKKNGAWNTVASAVIEGLNILNVFQVGRLVSQISTEHPAEGYIPKVTFVGSQFEDVRIGGFPVEIVLDLDICEWSGNGEYPDEACVRDKKFIDRVKAQRHGMHHPKSIPSWCKDKKVPHWVKDRYTWDNSATHAKDSVQCSLVKEIRGEFPGRPFGHAFEVPEFGKVFLGELLVDATTFRLIMFRIELGCGNSGSTSGGGTDIEGRTYP